MPVLKKVLAFFALFSSVSTLVCCALPALLVSLGLGASLASFLGNYPQLIWFSEHKGVVFTLAGLMLLATGVVRRISYQRSCPTDPELREACSRGREFSSVVYYCSIALYAVGAFFAFVAPTLFG